MKAKLIVALDVDTWGKAKKLVDALYPVVKIFKVGSQLFTGCGPKAIEYIRKKGADVFLDLKFYDIPNTVACAVRQAVRLGAMIITVHISGGCEMLETAVAARDDEAKTVKTKTTLVGVTVLTSKKASVDDVLILAREGIDCGLDGIVCSVHESAMLREKISGNFIIVTPGIRPEGADLGDQKRAATPATAVKNGSDFLVVGRPIIEAKDPVFAAKEILKQMNNVR